MIRAILSAIAIAGTWLGTSFEVALAKDYFLTIGGGYSPAGNQVSLEKNVLFFEKLLQEQYAESPSHDVFFSDGRDPGRDVQFHDPEFEVPRAQQLLAQVFQQTRYLDYQYRSHQVDHVRGGSNREELERWFDEVGGKLEPGDRLLIYVTAHGGRAKDKKQPHNTVLYLWNSQPLPMVDLAKWLDKVPPDVAVVTVMVQCYAGGFANLIFDGGTPDKGCTQANRCGFFATVQDRGAAGCTPDIAEADYQEYSSYFWAAIRGRTRADAPIQRPDYNQDGSVSFAEAHAFVMLTSPTIDIPIKTSDAFLRRYSKLPGKEQSGSTNKEAASPSTEKDTKSSDTDNLLGPHSAYTLLLKYATAAELAVLDGLSAELQLSGEERGRAAADLAEKIQQEKKKLEEQRKRDDGELRGLANEIKKRVLQRWPELANHWHPRVIELLSSESVELIETIETHPKFARFQELRQLVQQQADSILDTDRKWVKCQRLIRALENVAMSANLSSVAPSEIQARFKQLLAAECGCFTLGGAPILSQNELPTRQD